MQKMMDEFKNDPWKTIYVTVVLIGLLMIISMVVLPAIFIIAVRPAIFIIAARLLS